MLLISASILFSAPIYAQGQGRGQGMASSITGTVSGKVIDKSDQIPVEYANIAIYRLRDSSLVTGGITNNKGEFRIEKVPGGRHFAEVKFIGYNSFTVESFAITPKNVDANLGELQLEPASENMEAVVVTGQRKMLTHNLDKKVFSVDKDINAEGGSALEIMQNIPSLEVDMDGNLSLRGSQNVTILVDGKPSTYTSIDEIPASIIETVEVITNPSARYDPDGLSGIVNIVLKKKRDPGYHGMVTLNAGTGDKYNGSLNLNYREDKVNIFTNISYRQHQMNGVTLSDRITTLNTGESTLLQNQDFTRQGKFINVKGGIDYYINSSNTLTLSGGLNTRNFGMWDVTQTDYSTPIQLSNQYFRQNDGFSNGNAYNASLNYKLNGKQKGQELTADVFFFSMMGNNGSDMTQWWEQDIYETLYEQTQTNFIGNNLTLQTDFVQPVGNGGRLEAGLKAMLRSQDNDYIFLNKTDNTWTIDPLRSNNFIYSEQQYSAYAIYSNTFANGKFSYQGGLRVEQAFTDAQQLATNDEPIKRNFLNYFPSAHIKWDIDEKNSTQFAYSRRVSRPHTRMLNPFIDYSDPLNLSMGNPWLNPEFTNSLELSYYFNLPKTKLSVTPPT